MNELQAVYLGKIVDKNHFRAFIYAPNGASKLVNSWEEFERHISAGTWCATIEEANAINVEVEKQYEDEIVLPKPKKKEVKKQRDKSITDDLTEVI